MFEHPFLQSKLLFRKETMMEPDMENVVQNSSVWLPNVGACYRNGWRQLWKYVLELLLITIIAFLISLPGYGLSGVAEELEEMEGTGAIVGAALFGILALAYTLLLSWPINYGVAFTYLKAVRGDELNVKDMFDVFQNYLNAVLANLLVAVIIGIGIVLLIVPGIIFACRLAFTPYLVVDRKMEVIEAVKESWHMTKGYGWRVFLIGLLGFPIFIAGAICMGVGIIAAIMWIGLAFASLYHAVSISRQVADA
jgi:uncharacterized membrane protein